MLFDFYRNKNVFVTGHTGFKGSWLCKMLVMSGANVTGYSLDPPTTPNLYESTNIKSHITSIIGDIRNYSLLKDSFFKAEPEIVFHLAAQPIVLDSYKLPAYTFETNVMGTVNILECVRESGFVRSFINVTTDKVYCNNEWAWGYRENDRLDGYDPYSNSKSCSELVTASYNRSFFHHSNTAISTVRAGNVIGGGDFANNRIIPDCIRAASKNEVIIVRNPNSIRPYQHVLEPLYAYMLIAQKQFEDKEFAGSYNVGPDEQDCINTGELVDMFCKKWGDILWETNRNDAAPHEANFLKLDCSKIKSVFGWKPRWHVDLAVEKTIEWAKAYIEKKDIDIIMQNQINEFMKG